MHELHIPESAEAGKTVTPGGAISKPLIRLLFQKTKFNPLSSVPHLSKSQPDGGIADSEGKLVSQNLQRVVSQQLASCCVMLSKTKIIYHFCGEKIAQSAAHKSGNQYPEKLWQGSKVDGYKIM